MVECVSMVKECLGACFLMFFLSGIIVIIDLINLIYILDAGVVFRP